MNGQLRIWMDVLLKVKLFIAYLKSGRGMIVVVGSVIEVGVGIEVVVIVNVIEVEVEIMIEIVVKRIKVDRVLM